MFKPREIEDVMVLAGEKLNAVVAGLCDSEVTLRFGHRIAKREGAAVDLRTTMSRLAAERLASPWWQSSAVSAPAVRNASRGTHMRGSNSSS